MIPWCMCRSNFRQEPVGPHVRLTSFFFFYDDDDDDDVVGFLVSE